MRAIGARQTGRETRPTGRYITTHGPARRTRGDRTLEASTPGSTWGDWGDDDELGSIDLITPGKVQGALDAFSNASRFVVTASPLRMPGVVGTPVTPVATV